MIKRDVKQGYSWQVRRKASGITLLVFAGLALCAGCATCQNRVLGLGETSRLAGEWAGPMTTEARWNDGKQTLAASSMPAQAMGIVIRSDGSFDLGASMLAVTGNLTGLRRTGDQARTGRDQTAGTLRVVWTDYTATSSRMAIAVRPDKEMTKKEAGSASAGGDQGILFYSGFLREDGTLSYQDAIFGSPTHESVVRTGVLARVPSRAEAARQAMRDYPLPDHVIAKRVDLQKLMTTAGNEFFLITPKGKREGLPLIVVIPWPGESGSAEHEADCWRHQVDNLQIAVAVPVFGVVPEEAYTADDWRPAARLTGIVRDVTAAAKKAERAGKSYLLAQSLATVVAHSVWQSDNSDYDGFVATSWWSGFRKKKVPTPGDRTDLTKPVYFFWMEPLGPGIYEVAAATDWYREHGFTNVFGVSTKEAAVDKHERYMASVVIGQKPVGVTIRAVSEDYPRPIPLP
jgi:hypothetical protein